MGCSGADRSGKLSFQLFDETVGRGRQALCDALFGGHFIEQANAFIAAQDALGEDQQFL